MTPILWRAAAPQDAAALSILGGATFLASFAHDHPGAALIDGNGHDVAPPPFIAAPAAPAADAALVERLESIRSTLAKAIGE